MFTVTDKALEVIKDFIKEKNVASAVRITLAMGCSGPALGMALDEPANTDEVFEEKGTKFVIDKDIYNQAKPINVDFVDTPHGSGFKINSSLAPAAGDACGSCCSC
jgi:iron-sulfur cluster assembly accessory protein